MDVNSETIMLRQASGKDKEVAIELIHELNVAEAAIQDDRHTDMAAAAAYYAELMQRLSTRSGKLILADVNSETVGLMGFSIDRDAAYIVAERNRHGSVTDLVVRKAWRGKGVGRRLLEEAERLTKEAGLKRLNIGVLHRNTGAAALYREFGFEPYIEILTKDF